VVFAVKNKNKLIRSVATTADATNATLARYYYNIFSRVMCTKRQA